MRRPRGEPAACCAKVEPLGKMAAPYFFGRAAATHKRLERGDESGRPQTFTPGIA
jgi:hypothetical protein